MQQRIVEMCFLTPQSTVANSAFRNQAMDIGVPFEVTAKSVQDTNELRGEKFGFVVFVEHTEDNTANGRKKAV